jgi:hypothetical protein
MSLKSNSDQLIKNLLVVVDVNLSESPMGSLVFLEVIDFSVDFCKQVKNVQVCEIVSLFCYEIISISSEILRKGIESEFNFASSNGLDGRLTTTKAFNSQQSSALLISLINLIWLENRDSYLIDMLNLGI